MITKCSFYTHVIAGFHVKDSVWLLMHKCKIFMCKRKLGLLHLHYFS